MTNKPFFGGWVILKAEGEFSGGRDIRPLFGIYNWQTTI